MKPYFQIFSQQELPTQLLCSTVNGQGRPVIAAPHWHREIECYLFLSGVCTVQVEQQRYTAQPGDLFIVNRDQLHALYSVGDQPCSYLLLIFDYDAAVGHPSGASVFQRETRFQNPLRAQCPDYAALCALLRQIHSEILRPGAAQMLILHGLTQQFCGLLIRCGCYRSAGAEVPGPDRSREMIEETLRFVHERYAQPITLSDAAQAARMSVPHFCRRFKETTGMTFGNYLTYYRARRACALLRQDATLETVAQECGFGSTATLIRCFHKFYQCAPKTYAKGL